MDRGKCYAFPGRLEGSHGLTIREYFSLNILQGLISDNEIAEELRLRGHRFRFESDRDDELARRSVRIADILIDAIEEIEENEA